MKRDPIFNSLAGATSVILTPNRKLFENALWNESRREREGERDVVCDNGKWLNIFALEMPLTVQLY